jgi:hypothetical protein
VRDRVEAGGGAVGARAGRLVLGVEDDVLGRLAATTRTRHLWSGFLWVRVRVRVTDRVRVRTHDHTRATSTEWLGLG